ACGAFLVEHAVRLVTIVSATRLSRSRFMGSSETGLLGSRYGRRRRPARVRIRTDFGDAARLVASGEVDDRDLLVAPSGRDERDVAAVRRDGWTRVRADAVGVDLRLAALEVVDRDFLTG